MIIEIRHLPTGQKIKHINVDIEFDDVEETTRITTANSSIEIKDEKSHVEKSSGEKPATDFSNISPTRPAIPEKREHKEIPAEMKDLEL